jgi:Tol biopolymer transport system component
MIIFLHGSGATGRAQEQAKVMLNDERLSGQIYSPKFSRLNPELVAYERQIEDRQELYIYNYGRRELQLIKATGTASSQEEDILNRLFESRKLAEFTQFDGQLDWRPTLDEKGRQWFVFVSNGGAKSFDLYLSYVDRRGVLATEAPIRLAHDGVDQFPKWSPDGKSLVFVSGGKSGGDLFVAQNMNGVLLRGNDKLFLPVKLTNNPGDDNYPVWSPNSKFIAYEAMVDDGNRLPNWGINVINIDEMVKNAPPPSRRLTMELESYNEYKPSWSSSGSYIAYYVSQTRVDQPSDIRLQDIGVLAIITNSSTGRIESGRVLSGISPRLARNVIPNTNSGPSWGASAPGSQLADLIFYVKRDEPNDNPINGADFKKWQSKKTDYENTVSKFGTKLHRDIVVTDITGGNRFAFVSQVRNKNQLQIFDVVAGDMPSIESKSRGSRRFTAVGLSLVLPGLGQSYKGQKTKGLLFAAAEAAAVTSFFIFNSSYNDAKSGYEKARKEYVSLRSSQNNRNPDFDESFEKWQDEFERQKSAANKANVAVGIAAGVWALNVFDSLIGSPVSSQRFEFRRFGTGQFSFPKTALRYDDGVLLYSVGATMEF